MKRRKRQNVGKRKGAREARNRGVSALLAVLARGWRERSPRRLAVILAAALAFGAALGLGLGTRQAAKHAASVVPAPEMAAKAISRNAPVAPAPAKRAAAIPEGRLAGALPLLSEAPPLRPGETVAAGKAPAGPALITAQKDPSLVYEEVVEEPELQRAAAPSRGALRPQPGGGEKKPVLVGALEHLSFKPAAGPQPPWLQNARAMPELRGRPMVALVIDDAGVDRKRTERAMHLPPRVTMSFLPYAQEVARQVEAARALGHEIIVHVPMEPENASIDPGPNVLRVADSAAEIRRRLDWDLSRFTGYVGINNHMGSKFTQDAEGMRTVLEALKARGLLFLDSRTVPGSVGFKIARELGLPALERDVFLDNVDSSEAVAARLQEVARTAHRDGYVIAIGHPRDATLDVLERWVAEADGEGLVLVPLSAVMRALIAAGRDQARLPQARG